MKKRMKESKRNDKKMHIVCLVLLSLFLLATHTACGTKSQNASSDGKDVESTASDNHLNDTIGGEQVFQSVLDGETLKAEKIENPCTEILEGILRGDESYQNEHKELQKKILEYVQDSELGFPENEEVYLSLHPVFSWDAIEETVIFGNPSALFFTQDMEAAGICSFYSDDEENFEIITIGSLDESVRRTLQEEPAERLLFVGNGDKELVLKEDNTILSGDSSGDVQVKGEYFQKADISELSFSYETLSADTMLIQ